MFALTLWAGLIAPPVQAAAPPGSPPGSPPAYALVVGSNRPGPGQEALSWADDDARRVREVLTELGCYDPGRVALLLDPSPAEVLAALERIGGELSALSASGEQAVFFFYYSGHARAQALDLGAERLPLDTLRAELEGLESGLTLAVLDACQAGAATGVKGVEPAGDFSFNSVERLTTEGLAVMASSSASELSQESDALGGSYFTHHLVTGLRGAADADRDGAVTLTEAYHYTYHRTLVDTSLTAVGAQHVTLQTELRGRGDAVLTRTAGSATGVALAESLSGEVLLHRLDTGVVAAEVHKAAGEALSLALPAGDYQVTLRQGGPALRCTLALPEGALAPFDGAGCEPVVAAVTASKGAADEASADPRVERLMVEATFGLAGQDTSAYTDTLQDFGFEGYAFLSGLASGAVAWTPRPYLALVAAGGIFEDRSFTREYHGLDGYVQTDTFSWTTWRASASLRAYLPLLGARVVPFVQAGAGPALGLTRYSDTSGETAERYWGLYAAAAGGLQLMPARWRHLGVFAQLETSYAPVIENLLGDVHNSGAPGVSLGLRAGY